MQVDPAKLGALISALVAALAPQRIILFGSRARDEARPDSDYDLLLVAETDLPPSERAFVAHAATRGTGAANDVVVYTRAEFERLSGWLSSIPAIARREGVVVYEAA